MSALDTLALGIGYAVTVVTFVVGGYIATVSLIAGLQKKFGSARPRPELRAVEGGTSSAAPNPRGPHGSSSTAPTPWHRAKW